MKTKTNNLIQIWNLKVYREVNINTKHTIIARLGTGSVSYGAGRTGSCHGLMLCVVPFWIPIVDDHTLS